MDSPDNSNNVITEEWADTKEVLTVWQRVDPVFVQAHGDGVHLSLARRLLQFSPLLGQSALHHGGLRQRAVWVLQPHKHTGQQVVVCYWLFIDMKNVCLKVQCVKHLTACLVFRSPSKMGILCIFLHTTCIILHTGPLTGELLCHCNLIFFKS